jgi:single-strand DNA-binding protein
VADSLSKGARVIVTGRLEQRSWETSEGEKRSKVEVVADEVGPSLRWATAKVEKNNRKSPDGGRGEQGGEAGGRPVPTEAPAGYGDDEEPF